MIEVFRSTKLGQFEKRCLIQVTKKVLLVVSILTNSSSHLQRVADLASKSCKTCCHCKAAVWHTVQERQEQQERNWKLHYQRMVLVPAVVLRQRMRTHLKRCPCTQGHSHIWRIACRSCWDLRCRRRNYPGSKLRSCRGCSDLRRWGSNDRRPGGRELHEPMQWWGVKVPGMRTNFVLALGGIWKIAKRAFRKQSSN